ncbi:MAG: sn-glycerol-1-phosphate dehydrogenase [Clostridiales bacterium]|nr:sn-glycerol-1-phosphate dehydrogenase [Clostridiales bacterium]
MKVSEVNINDLIMQAINCDCGHIHSIDLRSIIVGSNAIDELPGIMKNANYKKAFLVSDKNTYEAAGKKVEDTLDKADIPYSTLVFKEEELIPDEKTVGSLCMAYDDTCDIMIAIGAGTINDIVKFFSYKMKTSYFVVGTAPSMDGFISSSAAMTKNNLKTTYTTHVPEVFIGDLDILSKAPGPMIAAGFADILGKYTCLQDWKLSSIINEEYYCDYIVDLMTSAVNKTMESFDGLLERKNDAIEKLTYGLLISGIAMSFIGNSRPASGSEHHLSHFWEILFQYEGKKPVLHGEKVGIGTIISVKAYEYLCKSIEENMIGFDEIRQSHNFSYPKWESEMKRVYPSAWQEIVELEKESLKNSKENWERRIEATENKLDQIKKVCENLPASEKIEQMIKELDGPAKPVDVGIDESAVFNAILYAKEIRNRYTILQLFWDLGLIEEFADIITANK